MPMVKLVSAQPIAFGKNALLQKRLENQCNHLTHDHKVIQRKMMTVAEQCVVSAYSLLLEAEQHEKEKIDRGEIVYDSNTGKYSQPPKSVNVRKRLKGHKVRPLTAAGHGTSTPRPEADKRRPASAIASLGKPTMLDAPVGVAMVDEEDDHTFIDQPKTAVESLNESVLRGSQSRTSLVQSMATSVISDNRENLQNDSHSQRIPDLLLEDHKKTERKSSAAISANRVRLLLNSQKNRKPLEQEMKSPTQSDRQVFAARSATPEETRPVNTNSQNQRARRPRTADDYRRKYVEDEMATYWNKRVVQLVNRWNLEDRKDPFLKDEKTSDQESIIPPPIPHSPEPEIPNRLKEPEGEAALKTKKFIQTYGSHFRSLLRPNSAPSIPEFKNKRRPVKVSRQELASIKADISRRRKQTTAILKKSRRLRSHIQSLAGWKYEG